MADDSRRTLTRLLLGLLLGVVVLGGGLALAPDLLARLLAPATPETVPRVTDPADIDAFMAASLPRVGATHPLVRDERDGVAQAVYRLPRGSDPIDAAARLREMASAEGIELYASPSEGLDARIRAYAGPDLRHMVLFVPDLPERTRAPAAANPRLRPLVALVIAGLGESSARDVVSVQVPLTLAIRPYTPFALRLGQDAARNWHEVLVDLSAPEETGDLAAAWTAVPYASGMLIRGAPTGLPGKLPASVVVHPTSVNPGHAWDPLPLLAAQRTGRASAQEVLARTCHLAIHTGAAAMIVQADDPRLASVLRWAATADQDGYRLALASEVVRAEQVRGEPWPSP